MTAHIFAKQIRRLLGLCLMFFALTSCTYDYFVDENNFRLYIPQIKEAEISILYVAIHEKATGRHVLTRELKAPFDKDENTQKGILRFKIPYGEYYVSCFADYSSATVGSDRTEHDNSYISAEQTTEANTYNPGMGETRMLISTATAFPIGHPNASIPLLVDMNESTMFRGTINIRFKSLPTLSGKIPDKIEIRYKGNATQIGLNGKMRRFSPQDNYVKQYPATPDPSDNNRVSCSTNITPSDGASFGWLSTPLQPIARSTASGSTDLAPIEFDIHFYHQEILLGTVRFGEEEFRVYQHSASGEDVIMETDPASGAQVRADKLTLKPRQNMTIEIDGLMIVGLKLTGWGEIIEGEITPI